MATGTEAQPVVLLEPHPGMLALILNRPQVINTLNLEMIRLLHRGLEMARGEARFRFLLLWGAGDRGYCPGGDLKALAQAVKEKAFGQAEQFFNEEYALDLLVHRFPKPVIVLADGITMGGGLGLAAGADIVVATESTRMAMPETRIGFFPDVGASGWLFQKCPPGYPEYLGLTGYEMAGAESVRLGLATHLTRAAGLPELIGALENFVEELPAPRPAAAQRLRTLLSPYCQGNIPTHPALDQWVAAHFAGKASLREIMASLSRCSLEDRFWQGVYHRLSERSPTALALTLRLLRRNEGRPLQEVLAAEARRAQFMIRHSDYLEGIRARILDKDDRPRWQPGTIAEVEALELEI